MPVSEERPLTPSERRAAKQELHNEAKEAIDQEIELENKRANLAKILASKELNDKKKELERLRKTMNEQGEIILAKQLLRKEFFNKVSSILKGDDKAIREALMDFDDEMEKL